MSAVLQAARLQLTMFVRTPAELVSLALTPAFALIFIGVITAQGRADLLPNALVAPPAIAMLGMAVSTSGSLVDLDRHTGTLELLLAAPTSLAQVLFGRIVTVTAASLLSVGEVLLVARLFVGADVVVERPWLFLTATVLMALATIGTALAMAALFVRARYAVTFQNAVSYPLFLLGGVLVPVSHLPDWLEPLSRLLHISWATDLMRASLGGQAVGSTTLHLVALSLLAALNLLFGWLLVDRLSQKARSNGEVGFA